MVGEPTGGVLGGVRDGLELLATLALGHQAGLLVLQAEPVDLRADQRVGQDLVGEEEPPPVVQLLDGGVSIHPPLGPVNARRSAVDPRGEGDFGLLGDRGENPCDVLGEILSSKEGVSRCTGMGGVGRGLKGVGSGHVGKIGGSVGDVKRLV